MKTKKPITIDRLMGEVLFRRCFVCGQWKILNNDNFYKDSSMRWGFNRLCRPCIKQIQKRSWIKRGSLNERKYRGKCTLDERIKKMEVRLEQLRKQKATEEEHDMHLNRTGVGIEFRPE